MNKVCYGCGVKLQSSDEGKLGYIPEKKIDSAKYCMRCFRMIHYGENFSVETPKEQKEIIRKVNNDKKFVIFLVDFLNINTKVINMFKSIKCKKVLIINKCELLPKCVNELTFLNHVKEYYNIKDDVKIKGGKVNHGAKSVAKYLNDMGIHDAYVLGLSNSGKSTLINDLIKIYDAKVDVITVNKKANTTLDFLRVKLSDDLTLIDSPGFIVEDTLNKDTINKCITAYSFNIKECDTLSLIDNKYFIKFDGNTKIVFYTNSDASKVIKKYYKAADGLVNNLKIEKDNVDIVINGLGFISVKSKVNITTNIDLKYLELRDSVFGGSNE